MKFIADLHIHSHFSRATARNLNPEHLTLWAKKKGITLVGTGDFTHPGWVAELQEKLVPAEGGLFALNPEQEREIDKDVAPSCRNPVRFLLSGEISCIYKRGERTRKVHNLVLLPDFEAAIKLNRHLDRIGNIHSDGRPILGLDSRDLLEIVLEASDRAFFIPAHIWTPWFSLFGSKSGFDTVEECFGDLTPHIHALETGLSSDPPMNRLLSSLDGYQLVSNSDAHSPAKLGREANLFDTLLDYNRVCQAMTDGKGFLGTIEFFPEEGKYHLDGHRKCDVRLQPNETKDHKGLCPTCGKPVTVGVLHRVHELADRDEPKLTKDFYSLIPLTEILAEILRCGPGTKKVAAVYEDLLSHIGPEIHILMDAEPEEIEKSGGPILAKAIERMRKSTVIREGGYDGEFGIIRLFEETEISELLGQATLFPRTGAKRTPTARSKGRKSTRPSGAGQKKIKDQSPPESNESESGDPILGPLNPAQHSAVLHENGHLLIVAGPGTGKTLTLTHRMAYLIRSGRADRGRIMALTFTNKAAKEVEERIRTLTPSQFDDGPRIGTFHGLCLEILRDEGGAINLPPDFRICPEQDVPILARKVMAETGRGKRSAAQFLKRLPLLKRGRVMGYDDDFEADDWLPSDRYRRHLRRMHMLDLDDLEVETLRLFHEHPSIAHRIGEKYSWIFVDEYQDTNAVQVEILKSIVNPSVPERSICAIGDPDQAIYGFRGAEVRHFERFKEDFPDNTEIVLTVNYRSSQTILKGAANFMGREEPLRGTRGEGPKIARAACRTGGEEAEMIVEQIERLMGGTSTFSLDSGRVSSHVEGEHLGFGDIAVLYRLNAQGDALEEALSRAGIPMTRSGEAPLAGIYPINVLWRFFLAGLNPNIPLFREGYLSLAEVEGRDGEACLTGFQTKGTIESIIRNAIEIHGFEELSDRSVQAVDRFQRIAAGFEGNLAALMDRLTLDRGIDHSTLIGDRTSLMSLHGAKGLEWPVVFITGCEEGLLPCTLFGDRNGPEEERLFYVGVTRAKQRLILSHASRRTLNGRSLRQSPHPFLIIYPMIYSSLSKREVAP